MRTELAHPAEHASLHAKAERQTRLSRLPFYQWKLCAGSKDHGNLIPFQDYGSRSYRCTTYRSDNQPNKSSHFAHRRSTNKAAPSEFVYTAESNCGTSCFYELEWLLWHFQVDSFCSAVHAFRSKRFRYSALLTMLTYWFWQRDLQRLLKRLWFRETPLSTHSPHLAFRNPVWFNYKTATETTIN